MKKKEFAFAVSLLTAVSALCLKGMKAVGRRLEKKDTTFDDVEVTEYE